MSSYEEKKALSKTSKRSQPPPGISTGRLLGLDTFVQDLDFDDLLDNFRKWTNLKILNEESETKGKPEVSNYLLVSLIVATSALSFFFSSFVVLIPLLHGFGGHFLHRREGWRFYQPGIGGPRFVALNGVAWTFYAVTIVLHVAHMVLGDFALYLTAFITGLFSLSFMLSSLFAFQNQNHSGSVEASKPMEEYEEEFQSFENHAPEFSEKLQNSVIMKSGETVSGLWWVFVTLQLSLAFSTAWILTIVDARSAGAAPLKVLTSVMATMSFAGCVPVTHAIGGKWKNIRTNFTAFQPGIGGAMFVFLQAMGWTLYSGTFLLGLLSVVTEAQRKGKHLMLVTAATGLLSELFIFYSLFFFKGNDYVEASNPMFDKKMKRRASLSPYSEDFEQSWAEKLLDRILSGVFAFANFLFGPGGDLDLNTRAPLLKTADDHLKADAKWNDAVKHIAATGDQYLVVGCGFVGKRLVKRLVERGETKIRVFDVMPTNAFDNFPQVEFVRGDVTNINDIGKACEGVDTIYATFALIRFMDRLEHQVKLSYHVNVTGTKVLFEAARANRVKRIVVTSSSHATTDERSKPRFNRTEEAPYVTRATAHNHYGWTKALADEFALSQNSDDLKVVVIRPCSGVFGGDDRTSFEKCVDLGVAPGIGSFCIMDWVYVENVVLGHLLAEAALQENNPDAEGQAFNISNNDATTWMDFWFLVKKICQMSPKSVSSKVRIEFCFVPMTLIWITAYFSEFVQRVSKGKVSLGKDVDSLTPAMLSTAMMSYSYKSEKARKVLGYEPVFTLDEGVQRSVWEYYRIKYQKKPLF